ncbi:dihydroorotase [Levilactobacillus bambusae]|uniref:Dihydroorotase n=1 Tax=Levilactobacillus bambusae TaxID=2024736 RepID=A0A2V1MXF1_9LACO|nr:dihydroorotase [Levilactobacillus bambusae]PWF99688.1 dihydroorotase [Levilactobacillus bambusae]
MTVVLKNAQVLHHQQIVYADILMNRGAIQAIGRQLHGDHEVDLTGKLVLPGFIDVHVHLREPGETDKETVQTGALAAAHGGYTTIAAMPNVVPAPDSPARMQSQLQLNQKATRVHVLQYATLTKSRGERELVDFKALKAAGAFAFSNDGAGIQTAGQMWAAMQAAAEVQRPIVAHVQDDSLFNHGVMNAGQRADQLGLRGIPAVSESAQLARDLVLAGDSGVHYHVCHVSTAKSVQLIRQAKAAGVHVTAEVTPHHLLLDENFIQEDDPQLKMNPPLRTPADRLALLKGLRDGTIDMIATDHAPHTKQDKVGSMATAAFGITGLETAFNELYTQLVQSGWCTLPELVNWLSTAPAEAFNLNTGRIAVGFPADLTVVDLETEHQIQAADFLSRGKNSPFIGDQVRGRIDQTYVNGQLVYLRGQKSEQY